MNNKIVRDSSAPPTMKKGGVIPNAGGVEKGEIN